MEELVPHHFPVGLKISEYPKDMNPLFPIESVTAENFRKKCIGELNLENNLSHTNDSPHIWALPLTLF
jgi:hypothetical protein